MVKALIATTLLLFGLPQGIPPNVPGAIEGRVVRTSTSGPISGVQIVLVPPAPPANAPPQPGQAAPTAQAAPQIPQGAQILRNADGSVTIQGPNGTVVAQVPAGVSINPQQLEALLNSGSAVQKTAVTDSDGKFAFQDLAPGT